MPRSASYTGDPKTSAIGVDIGGTQTKLVLIDQSGVVLGRKTVPTPNVASPEAVIGGVAGAVRAFRANAPASSESLAGIGVCTPNFTDGPDWVQRQANNMPSLEGYPLRPQLEEELGAPLFIAMDSTAAAIAERLFGQGRDAQRLLTMSIGTGVSIGVVTEEGAVDFNWGSTGDSGQIIVDAEATERCPCGGLGCLESVAAAPAIRRAAIRALGDGRTTSLADIYASAGNLEAADVVSCAANGDIVAIEILGRVGHFIGMALASYLHMFRPELIVLCGGVGQAGELLLRPVRTTVQRLASPWYLSRLRGIEMSAFPLDGAGIGAAALVFGLHSVLAAPAPTSRARAERR